METMLTLFGLPLTRYGLGSAAAMLAVLLAAGAWCAREKTGYSAFIRLAALAIPMTWLVSRLVYVLSSYSYYLYDLGYVRFALYFWDGGYSMMGAYLGLVLAGCAAERLCRVSRGTLLDALGIGMPLGLVISRLCERGTGLGDGKYVDGDWPLWLTVDSGFGPCNAVFVYEALTAAAIFAALVIWALVCRRRRGGDVLGMFTLLFGCTQVVLESLRDDGHMEVHMGVHVQQVIAAVLIVAVIALWGHEALRQGNIHRVQAGAVGIAVIAAVALAVVAEFGVDRWDSKTLAYGIMTACLLALLALGVWMRRAALCGKEGQHHGA